MTPSFWLKALWVIVLWVAAVLTVAAAPHSLAADTAPSAPLAPLAGGEKIVVFADVHGAADALRSLLRALQLIDIDNHWIGGETRLVSLGDLLDRGPASRQVMDLLMSLEAEAPESGGQVHVVLGNHEIMNLTGDLRYVSLEEYAEFADDELPADRNAARLGYLSRHAEIANPEAAFSESFPPGYFGHRKAFSQTGRYGRWLLSKPQVLVLNGTAFVHGGLSEELPQTFTDLETYNRQARMEVEELLKMGERLVAQGLLPPWQDLLTASPTARGTDLPAALIKLRESMTFNNPGPTWYRGTAACHTLIEQPRFERTLEAFAITRVIMGHTTTFPREVQQRFGGRAILADTGMLASHYRGRPSAVIIESSGLSAWHLGDQGTLEGGGLPQATPADIRTGDEATFIEAVRRALKSMPEADLEKEQLLSLAGRSYRALFSNQAANQRLATYQLDKLLGLGLATTTIPYTYRGKSGILEVLPANSISEQQRLTDEVYRPNWCSNTSDYQLMYVFDMLIGKGSRSGTEILYDRATWGMYLNSTGKAFPTSTRVPKYLRNRKVLIPEGLRQRLAEVDLDTLEQALGEFLSQKQIHALNQRRLTALAAWSVEE